MLNTSKAPVSVKIYSSNDTELYNETISGELNVGKIFDISNVEGDKCTFVITSDGRTFVEKVSAK